MSITPRDGQEMHESPDHVQHYYIEEENSRGRFIPNLLLLGKLHSKVDSTSNTLLGHMCSYNSPYLPLLIDSLSPDDEIINKRNNFGNSPLEIAALYSTKEVVDKLKAKGATGDIGSDYWAIRGGNLAVWSDTVPLDRPELVHWAAYNDLPEVLEKFRQKNVSLTTLDQNGSTPIDIAVVNKSYRAFKYLLGLGLLPNP
jgi:ankyrin repeat protein